MKKRTLFATIALSASLMAQGPRGGFDRDSATNGNAPADPVARQVAMLTRFLSLTTAQQTQVTNILAPNTTNLASLQASLKTERGNILTAIKSNSGISGAVSAATNTQAQIETIRATEAAAIYNTVLTADQKAKLGDGLGILLGGGGFGPGPRRGPPHKE